MNRARVFAFAALACCPVLLACSPRSAPPVAQTFDLGTAIFVKGDLHEAWEAAPATDGAKRLGWLEVTPVTKVDRRISRRGEEKGGVTGVVYATSTEAGTAYDQILDGVALVEANGADTQVVEGLGEQARSFTAFTEPPPAHGTPKNYRAGVLFLRGKTVVYIGLRDMKAEELIPYAKKIDARIPR
jgi:hypothetical protein